NSRLKALIYGKMNTTATSQELYLGGTGHTYFTGDVYLQATTGLFQIGYTGSSSGKNFLVLYDYNSSTAYPQVNYNWSGSGFAGIGTTTVTNQLQIGYASAAGTWGSASSAMQVFLNSTTASTSSSSGALVVGGGVGIGGRLSIAGGMGIEIPTGSAPGTTAATLYNVSGVLYWGGAVVAGPTRTVNYVIDGGGAVITTGSKGFVVVDFPGTIISWTILGDASGSLIVDVSKATYANFPGTFTASSGTSPTLSSAQKNQANINWSGFTTCAAGDIFQFTVSGTPATVTRVTVSIKISATA
ncbi:MAG: hypothetical protein JHC33_14755, partial [Ignisphaera sp.]|nr:hypothetical protein [Ignisphaera sp.]